MLFVGSGLSTQAGYPTWSALTATLVQKAKQPLNARAGGIDRYELKNDYFTLSEFARSALGPGQYIAVIREQFGKPVKPTEAHRVIAMTDYRRLITTNYDRLLETATTQVRQWAPNTFTADSISSLKEYVIISQAGPLIEVHRRSPDDTWILSEYSGMDGMCGFEAIDCEIPRSEIFRQVPFEQSCAA